METTLVLIRARINSHSASQFELYKNYQFMPYRVDRYGFKSNGVSSLYVRRIGNDVLERGYKGITENGFIYINIYEVFIINDVEVILNSYANIKKNTILTFKSVAAKRNWMGENIVYSSKYPCEYSKDKLPEINDFSPTINEYLYMKTKKTNDYL